MYQKTKREEQWEKVRLLTYKTLTAHLMNIVNEVFVVFSPLVSETPKNHINAHRQHLRPSSVTKKIIKTLIAELEKIPKITQIENSNLMWKLSEEIYWNLEKVSDILIPRVLQFSENQKIIEALTYFEYSRDQFEQSAYLDYYGYQTDVDLFDMIYFLKRTDELLDVLAQDWEFKIK